MTVRHTLIPLALAMLITLAGGCSKTNPRRSAGKRAPVDTGRFALDGVGPDDATLEPVLAECGIVGRGSFGHGIDLKQLYLDNDAERLYLYTPTEPSIAERYAEQQATGGLLELYIDTDNDPTTGCVDYDVFGYEPVSGYDRKVVLEVGVSSTMKYGDSEATNSYFLVLRVEKSDGAKRWDKTFGGMFDDSKAYVADSDTGVEMVLPLEELDLTPGDTVRMLLQEKADSFVPESCNTFTYQLKN